MPQPLVMKMLHPREYKHKDDPDPGLDFHVESEDEKIKHHPDNWKRKLRARERET